MLEGIEKALHGISLQTLAQSTRRLCENYRQSKPDALLSDEQIAYLATRMPATHAALCAVLEKVSSQTFRSLLDIGSGSGATLFAANTLFPNLETLYLVEKQAAFLKIGKVLTKELPLSARTQWIQADVEKTLPEFSCDLVIASYSLGEIAEGKQLGLVEQLWAQTQEVLVLVEPGTPQGFERLRRMRAKLLEKGAFLVAPCPHSGVCPMAQSDWCHFYTRLSRSSVHRRAKHAQLNYEDEKFAYLIVSRKERPLATSRILRHPRKGKGHVVFTLCTSEGVKEKIVTKKEGELYRIGKKKEWGDALDLFRNYTNRRK
jgi:ribosomal protein RSM22 (predicted rRNA methylase)